MALTATMFTIEIDLSDVDRQVYESFALKVAQHPSEADEFMVARVLAYCLEYQEGIAFSKGISEPDEPPVVVRDLTGALVAWIEVGNPDAARLHKASKASPRVAVYTHKDVETLKRAVADQKVHKVDSIAVYALDRALVADVVTKLERRIKLGVMRNEGVLYVTVGGETFSGWVERHSL